MTHIKTIGKNFCHETNIWIVSKHEQVECPVCFEEYPVSKFSICENGHFCHEKCLLAQIGASYSLGKSFNSSEDMQNCSICKGTIPDENCSESFHKMLPLIIAKNYCKTFRPDVWDKEKKTVLDGAIYRGAKIDVKNLDKVIQELLGEKKDLAKSFKFYKTVV